MMSTAMWSLDYQVLMSSRQFQHFFATLTTLSPFISVSYYDMSETPKQKSLHNNADFQTQQYSFSLFFVPEQRFYDIINLLLVFFTQPFDLFGKERILDLVSVCQ